jgi:AcrR family transcriptional regulator
MKKPPADLGARLLALSAQILTREDLRLEDIALEVGVARTTLYYYFSGRDTLVSYLLAEHLEQANDVIVAARSSADEPADQLPAVVEAMLLFLAEHPGVCTGLLSTLGAAGRLDEALRANEIYVARPVRELVQAAIDGGQQASASDTDDTVNALLGAVLMVIVGRSLAGRELGATDARTLAGRLLALVEQPRSVGDR